MSDVSTSAYTVLVCPKIFRSCILVIPEAHEKSIADAQAPTLIQIQLLVIWLRKTNGPPSSEPTRSFGLSWKIHEIINTIHCMSAKRLCGCTSQTQFLNSHVPYWNCHGGLDRVFRQTQSAKIAAVGYPDVSPYPSISWHPIFTERKIHSSKSSMMNSQRTRLLYFGDFPATAMMIPLRVTMAYGYCNYIIYIYTYIHIYIRIYIQKP